MFETAKLMLFYNARLQMFETAKLILFYNARLYFFSPLQRNKCKVIVVNQLIFATELYLFLAENFMYNLIRSYASLSPFSSCRLDVFTSQLVSKTDSVTSFVISRATYNNNITNFNKFLFL